jgi:DNA repair protein RadC
MVDRDVTCVGGMITSSHQMQPLLLHDHIIVGKNGHASLKGMRLI